MTNRIIPVLLYQKGGLYKTIKFSDPKYVGDPLNAIRIFNEKEVDELIFLDISASEEGAHPDLALIARIAGECFMPVCYGGGIRTLDDVSSILKLGIEKVCINSAAINDPGLIKEASRVFGSQSVVLGVDVKVDPLNGYEVMHSRGRKGTGRGAAEYARDMVKMGAGEVFINSIDRDGTRQGYDTNLIKLISGSVNVPVIACGGAGSMDDLLQILRIPGVAAAAGSLFVFYGPYRAVLINYPGREEIRSLL